MKRLTNEEVRVDESVDWYLGPLANLEGMKPKLLDLILNGPVLNGVSKDVLRQIIRQLYSTLAAYEDTGLTPERCAEFARADAEGQNRVHGRRQFVHGNVQSQARWVLCIPPAQ